MTDQSLPDDPQVLIHRSLAKQTLYRAAAPLSWSKRLNSWLTFDPAIIRAIQKSSAFRVADHHGETARIRARLGIDLSNIERTVNGMPMGVEGPEHAKRRRGLAQVLVQRGDAALSHFARLAQDLCQKNLGQPGARELIADLFEPLALCLASQLSGLALQPYAGRSFPAQLFDKSLGLSRRKLVDQQIADLRQESIERCPAGDSDKAVSLAILGNDTLLGAMALSFVERMGAQANAQLCEIDWGTHLTRTSVPFIERVALRDVVFGTTTIKAGQSARLYVDRFCFEDQGQHDAIFGTGRHVCLGRSISQRAWSLLGAALAQLPFTVTLEKIVYREADCMFLIPWQITANVHEG